MASKKQTTNLYWNDPDNGECSDFVKGFWKDSTIGVVLENGSEAEVNDWELEFKPKQDPITEMMRFQSDRLLNKISYDAKVESILTLEEVLESIGFDVPKENRGALTNSFKQYITTLNDNGIVKYDETKVDSDGSAKWEEQVDAHCDIIVFAIGALMKLGVDPTLALLETAKEINSRQGRLIDGKFTKFKEDEEGYEPTYTADYSKCKVNYD